MTGSCSRLVYILLNLKKGFCCIKYSIYDEHYFVSWVVSLTFIFWSQWIRQRSSSAPASNGKNASSCWVKTGISWAILKSASCLFALSIHMESAHASGCCSHPQKPGEKSCWKVSSLNFSLLRGWESDVASKQTHSPAEFIRRGDLVFNEITSRRSTEATAETWTFPSDGRKRVLPPPQPARWSWWMLRASRRIAFIGKRMCEWWERCECQITECDAGGTCGGVSVTRRLVSGQFITIFLPDLLSDLTETFFSWGYFHKHNSETHSDQGLQSVRFINHYIILPTTLEANIVQSTVYLECALFLIYSMRPKVLIHYFNPH